MMVIAVLMLIGPAARAQEDRSEVIDELADSLVYIESAIYPYDSLRPWRNMDLSQRIGHGCAVGPYEVLTEAYNVADAEYIKVRRLGWNEFIPARVKVIDYDSDLCLLELDRSVMSKPLLPVTFSEEFTRGSQVKFYWLSGGGRIESGRGYIDRVQVFNSVMSYMRFPNYVVSNVSQSAGKTQLFCLGRNCIGLSCWFDKADNESGVIPAAVINRFLTAAADGDYEGFSAVGMVTKNLLDPTVREYLKMPPDMKDGILVSDIYTLGTGSAELKPQDVILAIDASTIDAYGRYEDKIFGKISYEYLITGKGIGQPIVFDLWRNGDALQVQVKGQNFKTVDMLVPYYEFDRQPQYVVTAGFVIQKLSRKYLKSWGDNWQARVSTHLYHYLRDMAFKPSDQRRDIVILSRVLPADINLGYQQLKQLVVTKFNGKNITSLKDVFDAMEANEEGLFDVIEFENNQPTVVIPRKELSEANNIIGQNYGISRLMNVE